MHQALPHYGVGERLADGHIHVLGVTASIVGATALLVMASSLPAMSILSLTVYSIGLVAVFSFSAAYNLVSSPLLKAILRRFDHAAIYLKIAATYTPFALVKMSVWPGLGLLALVWAVAAFGLTTKLLFPGRLTRTSYVLYLAQGWAVVIALNPLAAAVSDRALLLLGTGGALYTIGVVFHLWHRLRYHNAIWHAFVLCASSCHYAAVVDAVFIS
jgi:hemolysin III